jgi:hypothetical protein
MSGFIIGIAIGVGVISYYASSSDISKQPQSKKGENNLK